jgi:hypothetical protein
MILIKFYSLLTSPMHVNIVLRRRLWYTSVVQIYIYMDTISILSLLRVDTSIHSDTLFWFRANQSLHVLLSVACLAEKQYVLGLTRSGSLPRFNIYQHFFKTLFKSQFLFDFDEICTNKGTIKCSFTLYFQYNFIILNTIWIYMKYIANNYSDRICFTRLCIYIMARTSYILIRWWWCLLCTRPTLWCGCL